MNVAYLFSQLSIKIQLTNYLPYSLNFSRVEIFMDFVDFGVSMKILPLKFLSYSIIQCSTFVIHENFIHGNC